MATSTTSEHLQKLQKEAASLKAKLDEVNASIQIALANQQSSQPTGGSVVEVAEETVRPRRVLLIEDESTFREMVARSIARLGHLVAVAENGAEGIVMIHSFQPEIVIIDLGLPDIDGCTLARHIRAYFRTDSPFLVACTGYSGSAVTAAITAAGFDRHVLKPLSDAALSQLLQSATEGHPPAPT